MRCLVLNLEAAAVSQHLVDIATDGSVLEPETLASWNPSPYLTDRNGLRLIEEISRRTKAICSDQRPPVDAIAITLPGTIEEHAIVTGSSRLGIHSAADFGSELRARDLAACYLFHDVECLALGEARYGKHQDADALVTAKENFAYVFVDEGIGSCLFLDGRIHRGAGVAGHLGRMVVQPNGAYDRRFSSRGPLEVFASRPGVSTNIVAEYLSEKDKREAGGTTNTAFRAAVATAATGEWTALSISHIRDGIRARDPIVTTVLEDAAQYLSIAINAIITIVNPPLILLGGAMIEQLPEFAASVTSASRRHAWAGSWNETDLRVASLGRRAQTLGAAEHLRRVLSQ